MMLVSLLALVSTRLPARGLEELEQRLTRTPPVSTPFVEYRFSHLLKKPLCTAGTLEYRADGVLARRVDAPYKEITEVDGDEVRVARGDRAVRKLSLQRAPQLRVLLGSFRALLEGRISSLSQDFEIGFSEEGANWTIQLKPRDATLARHLSRIEVHGADDQPRCLEALEPDGDGALTLFETTPAPAGLVRRDELQRRCGLSVGRASAAR